jgi:O-antigen ligase
MRAVAKEPLGLLSFRRWKDPASWATTVDIFAVLTAAALPWSTSLVAIFALALLVSMGPFLDVRAFLRSVKHPASTLPIALVALALLGTLWSDASWPARLYAVSPTAKLLVLPVLLYHYQRSTRAMWVFTAFLLSCTLLMAMSWIVAFDPTLALRSGAEYGVPVKNYIDQSQEFALCAVALAYPVVTLLRAGKIRLAVLLGAVALGFVVNMAFVVVSRTALVTMPIMLAVFAFLHLKWRTSFVIFLAAILLAALAWATSPKLQRTTESFFRDYFYYQLRDEPTSIGIRLEFWKKSLRFFAEAPIIGHGTGSTRGLFEHVATAPIGERVLASGQIVGNPHNQTLNVAVQWGAAGILVLYATWLVHLRLFRGDGLVTWIGLLVVAQNVFTSLFNSHLFDFHEGWMYVLGVGIAGGTVLRTGVHDATSETRNSASP